MMRSASAWGAALLALSVGLSAPAASEDARGLVPVPAGSYTPFQRTKAANAAEPEPTAAKPMAAFVLDVEPVTNAQFLAFVESHPEWRKSRVKALYVDGRYLRRWPADLQLADAAGAAPVTDVSWFAAQAYCKARGLRLPTTAQWDYALADAGRDAAAVRTRSLDWFAEPNGAGPGPIGGRANGYGVRDLVGLVWEWTYDFNAYATTAVSRDPNGKDSAAFCGGAAAGVTDPTDYPAFLRYAMRASLKANYTAENLGFRCAGGAP